MASTLGPERYKAQVDRRQEDVDEAELAWSEAMRSMEARGAAPEDVLDRWESMTIAERRDVIRAHVVGVAVEQADPKRRRWQPVEGARHGRLAGVGPREKGAFAPFARFLVRYCLRDRRGRLEGPCRVRLIGGVAEALRDLTGLA
jgi:hypothetical protein